ncbi:MAG: ATP-binding protein [Archangiaceae bacterium]|nr:ATP-binding protein [Archangiaceae bacterium]
MEFRDRAWFEAERYGADPWIFVRELMQNGRDAGARSVRFEVSERDGLVRLTCRDDGAGMTEAHARQFLFRLYASSKENQQGAAGRFGVGFWSILRFEPSQIVIRSWPKGGAPWEVTLDGALQRAASAQPLPRSHGTEVVLVKRLTPGVAEQVKRAARMHGRYLTTRADRHQPLQVTIDGEQVTQTMALPAPSATFERNGVRGVVGLGEVPGVELFSKGLHVRSASNVEELLSAPADEKGQGRKLDPMLDGLAPQVLLDGDHFSLVRSRSDARDDRALRKAVALSQRELARLIERQLQFSRPVPLLKRALRPALAAAAALAVLGGGAWVASALAGRGAPEGGLAASPLPSRGVTPAGAAAPLEPYRDPSTRYRGPRTDALPASPTFTDLQYWPQNQTLYFSALHLERPDDPAALAPRDVSERFPSRPCTTDCVRVALGLDAEQGWVRLPVPTGQVIDPATVVWNGAAARVYRTREGEPVVWAAGASRASVSYQTGPGLPPVAAPLHVPEVMPAEVPDVSALSTLDQVETLRRWVAEHVTYSNDPGVNARHRLHRRHGGDFVSRTLEVGAGDCDVQNALLAMLLQAADVRARLAVGYVGRNGAADPVLHAWVEYRAVDGWRVTDASAPLNAGAAKVAAAPPSVGPVPVAGRSVAYGATSWAAPLHARSRRCRRHRGGRCHPRRWGCWAWRRCSPWRWCCCGPR